MNKSNADAAQVLREALNTLEDPKCWTKGENARDARGNDLPVLDRGAVCFCALGAIDRAVQTNCFELGIYHLAVEFLNSAIFEKKFADIPAWNDAPERTHAEVIAAFEKAIELAEA
jgi:hypothetical protein